MAIIRKANSFWTGNLQEGKGNLSVESGVLDKTKVSFQQRFENENGTNPEELIGAAHATCFNMVLSKLISGEGLDVKAIQTENKVYLEKVGEGFSITKIDVACEVEAPGLEEEKLRELGEQAKSDCPVSKALQGVKFNLSITLNESVRA
ncbi:MAG: OsmC family peroxiredoxin [Cytophagaceae bacterium]